MNQLHGYYLEELSPGMEASMARTVTEADIVMFAGVTGDTNPVHLNEEYANATIFKGRIAHGMLSAGLISAVLGTKLPGPGCVYLEQNMRFTAPVKIGETVTATVTVKEIVADKKRVILETVCRVGDLVVVKGQAQLLVMSRQEQLQAAE